MNLKQKKRLAAVLLGIVLLSLALGFVLYALKQNINLFYTPSEALEATLKPGQIIRLGGYVKKQSVHYEPNGKLVHFIVTDRTKEMAVSFDGVLPNLFREGQTVVVTGRLQADHSLEADQVLAKHDERYMPKPLAKKLS